MEENSRTRKTYLLSNETIAIIDELSARYSDEANIVIGKGKIIELAIHAIRDMTLRQLLPE